MFKNSVCNIATFLYSASLFETDRVVSDDSAHVPLDAICRLNKSDKKKKTGTTFRWNRPVGVVYRWNCLTVNRIRKRKSKS